MTTLSEGEREGTELFDEEVVANQFESLFTGGWMAYTTRNKHFYAEAGTKVLVRFYTNLNGLPGVQVKFPDDMPMPSRSSSGWVQPDPSHLHRAKRELWYWPGLEDTVIACNLYESARCAMRPY